MKPRLRLTLVSLAALAAVGSVLYFTGVLGCSLPRTHIAQRKLYEGPTTIGSPVEDWPRWRGPREDQISRERLPDQWPAGGPKQLWAADVGLGYSSPIAAAGRVYLFSMNDRKETLTAFDAASGKILWSREGGEGWTSSYVGTRATPAIDADRIYTYGGQGELTCRNLADGQPRWTINILQTTGSTPNGWGMASSPLVAGNLVYVQSGQGAGPVVLAIDKMSGAVAWRSQATGGGGYAHPILIDVAGTPQLVVFAGDQIVAMNPADGRTIWTYPWHTAFNVNASSPIYHDGRLFVTSEYDHGCLQLQLSPAGATKIWENTNILGKFQGAILDDGYLYANSAGSLVCVHWADGSLKWKATDPKLRLGIGGSLIRSGDKLLLMSERGKLSLARATADGVQLIGQGQVVEGKEVWATPVLYGGRLYAKGGQELVCVDLTGR
ncbi:MAG TPA: PQQ-binding-like beta-propeller repeat protein [Tepidisphaeraceae bacterium]|jgi:outer membrane protein assembly factor BamB